LQEEFLFLNKTIIFAALSEESAEFFHLKEVYIMLIIDSKDCENIDKALKKYKKKFEKSRVLLQLRERQAFIKPSIRRRTEMLKAVYKQQLNTGMFDK
jgi:small subunit ribosomal protein S21